MNTKCELLPAGTHTNLQLKKLGPYTDIEGIDPAANMLDLGLERGIYSKGHDQMFYIDCGLPHGKSLQANHMISDFSLCKIGGV